MDTHEDLVKIKELLDSAKEVLVVTGGSPTFDSIGSALALSLGLAGLGKKVTVACPDPITVELSSFVGVNKIVSALSNKNFIISLDYVDGSIEKVSYNIEGNKFNLVIEPRAGYTGFSEDKVHYSHAGSGADAIFAVDTVNFGGLKNLYEDHKELFTTKPIINIDRHAENALYGKINLVDPQASATVEVVSQLLSGLGVRLTEDIATNVLNALYGGTNSFQNPTVSARAFELAAACLKAGGRRFAKRADREEEVPVVASESVASKPLPTVESVKPDMKPAEAPKTQAPPDWLKPKIYKSSNLL